MTTAEKLYKAVKDLPEPVIAELLDFAEFLRSKMRNSISNTKCFFVGRVSPAGYSCMA